MKKGIKTIEKIGKFLLVIMFSVSQLSFPIEVFADVLSQADEETVEELKTENTDENLEENLEGKEEENTSLENNDSSVSLLEGDLSDTPVVEDKKFILTVNDEDVTESLAYTLTEDSLDKSIKICSGYEGEELNCIPPYDFTDRLYGDYVIEVSEDVSVTIHYEGNNEKILKDYLDSRLSFDDGQFAIYGSADGISKDDFLKLIQISELEQKYHVKNVYFDPDDTNSLVSSGVTLLIETDDDIILSYSVVVYGDYNQDGLVNVDDAQYAVRQIISTTSEERVFTIFNATRSVFTTGKWNSDLAEANDELQNSLTNQNVANVGEEFVVKYSITGFSKDKLAGIEADINYNKELLSLVSFQVYDESAFGGISSDNHFAYLLSDYATDTVFMTITFKALAVGEANISIDYIMASLGDGPANLGSQVSSVITIDSAKGGDGDEDSTPVVPTPVVSENVVSTPTVAPVARTVTARTIALSSDNLIKSLTIKGYDISFDPNTLEYSLKVKNSVKSLDLEVVLNDESASYEISGNQNFKVGENVVTIKVTAEDGSERTYTIKVNRAKAVKTQEEEEEKSSSKTIIIILIILVIIGLIYVIFKDDEEDNKESKK